MKSRRKDLDQVDDRTYHMNLPQVQDPNSTIASINEASGIYTVEDLEKAKSKIQLLQNAMKAKETESIVLHRKLAIQDAQIVDLEEQLAYESLRVRQLQKYQALARYVVIKETQVQSESVGEQMEKMQYIPEIEEELENLENNFHKKI